ncbi:MAG TPA: hypothetical protein VGB91_01040 [Rhizomicrobium sp.]
MGQVEQLPAEGGQPERRLAPVEQRGLVTTLQGLELLGQSRLRDVQPPRRAADAALRRDHMKCAQMLMIHAHASLAPPIYGQQHNLHIVTDEFVTHAAP